MNLLLVTDSEADEETVDPATQNVWDPATLENIHDLQRKAFISSELFPRSHLGKRKNCIMQMIKEVVKG